MKKAYLFLIALISLSIINAQPLKVYNNGVEINESVQIVPKTGGTSADFFDIENISSDAVKFYVEIVKESLAEGADVMMCFDGSCLSITKTPEPILLEAGEKLEHKFDLLYTYDTDVKSVVVVNLLDEEDEIIKTFKVNYVDNVSLAEQTEKIALSATVRPNPASTTTTFNYTVPTNYSNAKLIVRNSLGSIIRETPIKTGVIGKWSINIADLSNGVYFYSIITNGTPILTKKLIIKH